MGFSTLVCGAGVCLYLFRRCIAVGFSILVCGAGVCLYLFRRCIVVRFSTLVCGAGVCFVLVQTLHCCEVFHIGVWCWGVLCTCSDVALL